MWMSSWTFSRKYEALENTIGKAAPSERWNKQAEIKMRRVGDVSHLIVCGKSLLLPGHSSGKNSRVTLPDHNPVRKLWATKEIIYITDIETKWLYPQNLHRRYGDPFVVRSLPWHVFTLNTVVVHCNSNRIAIQGPFPSVWHNIAPPNMTYNICPEQVEGPESQDVRWWPYLWSTSISQR